MIVLIGFGTQVPIVVGLMRLALYSPSGLPGLGYLEPSGSSQWF
jgi:hypothetical protein